MSVLQDSLTCEKILLHLKKAIMLHLISNIAFKKVFLTKEGNYNKHKNQHVIVFRITEICKKMPEDPDLTKHRVLGLSTRQ